MQENTLRNNIMYMIKNQNTDTKPSVKSALRALELLEFFAETRRPASVNEVCQTLGYPQSSTSVLLRSLADAGYLDYDRASGLYVPSIRVALATAWVQRQLFSERSLLKLMEQVLARTGHTVAIGRRQGVHVRYLHVLQSTQADRFLARIGALRPLFHSAAGKMLLTCMPDREMVPLFRRANAEETDASRLTSIEAVRAEREATRAAGYAMSTGIATPGAAAIAILLPLPARPAGVEPMSLSVGGPLREIKRDKAQLLKVLNESVALFRKAADEF